MLNWLQSFSIFCLLDNQDYNIAPHNLNCIAAAGATEWQEGNSIDEASKLFQKKKWLFGHLAYHLQQAHLPAASPKEDLLGFPPFFFFSPEIIIEIKENEACITAPDPQTTFGVINHFPCEDLSLAAPVHFQSALTKDNYIKKIKALQKHIQRGDCYEINFCQEFFATEVSINPLLVYRQLTALSPTPFAAFYRLHSKYLLCASPERFLCKKGNTIISQPMKGTAKRNLDDDVADDDLVKELRSSAKEQAENVMVVDLVRNDLTRICKDATVKVDELFGVYTFPQVHQMVSTISGELKESIAFPEIVTATFPMGSMTGAPKHRVMELIDEFEPSHRGIFSGSVGYIRPNGDFDFNVVIRSLMYNSNNGYLSYQVGSGITIYSQPQMEWEECLLKAAAIKKVLTPEPAP